MRTALFVKLWEKGIWEFDTVYRTDRAALKSMLSIGRLWPPPSKRIVVGPSEPVRVWLYEQGIRACIESPRGAPGFPYLVFESPEDAFAFKMRWC